MERKSKKKADNKLLYNDKNIETNETFFYTQIVRIFP